MAYGWMYTVSPLHRSAVRQPHWPCRDVLCELAAVGEVPLPPSQVNPMFRNTAEPHNCSAPQPAVHSFPQPVATPTQDRSSNAPQQIKTYPSPGVTSPSMSTAGYNIPDITLPMHSEELGRFPLHPAFNSTTSPISPTSLHAAWNSFVSGSSTNSPAIASGLADRDASFTSGFAQTSQSYSPNPQPLAPYSLPAMTPQQQSGRASASSMMDTSPSSSQWTDLSGSVGNDMMSMWSSAPVSMV